MANHNPDKFYEEKVLEVTRWAPTLFSFKLTRNPGYRFVAGQFAQIGIFSETGEFIVRAYSIASATYDEHLEFFSVVIPDGAFTSRLQHMKVGDSVWVQKVAVGLLTTARFEGGKDLWMLSTGTGLAPFMAVCQEPEVWGQYENVILVHCAREERDLAYREIISKEWREHPLIEEHYHRLKYLPIVTRDQDWRGFRSRIPPAIDNCALERAVGVNFHIERSRFMVCGGPEMAEDTRKSLMDRGYTLSRRGAPGHMAFENLW